MRNTSVLSLLVFLVTFVSYINIHTFLPSLKLLLRNSNVSVDRTFTFCDLVCLTVLTVRKPAPPVLHFAKGESDIYRETSSFRTVLIDENVVKMAGRGRTSARRSPVGRGSRRNRQRIGLPAVGEPFDHDQLDEQVGENHEENSRASGDEANEGGGESNRTSEASDQETDEDVAEISKSARRKAKTKATCSETARQKQQEALMRVMLEQSKMMARLLARSEGTPSNPSGVASVVSQVPISSVKADDVRSSNLASSVTFQHEDVYGRFKPEALLKPTWYEAVYGNSAGDPAAPKDLTMRELQNQQAALGSTDYNQRIKTQIQLIEIIAPKVPKFKPVGGYGDFRKHLQMLEQKIIRHNLPPWAKLQLLPETLDGEARNFYEKLPNLRDLNYTGLCETIIKQYAPIDEADHHHKEYNRLWRYGESFNTFAQDKLDAMCAMYPHNTSETLRVEKLFFIKFCGLFRKPWPRMRTGMRVVHSSNWSLICDAAQLLSRSVLIVGM